MSTQHSPKPFNISPLVPGFWVLFGLFAVLLFAASLLLIGNTAVAIVVAIASAAMLWLFMGFYSVQPGPPHLFGRHFYRGDARQKHIALTFDDGPDPVNTPALLDLLAEHNVKATFFLLGKKAEADPDIVARIAAEGHVIGNHSWNHKFLVWCGRRVIIDEIQRTQMLLSRLTGSTPRFFRPPFGARDHRVAAIARGLGLQTILWSCVAYDWKVGKDEIVQRIRKTMAPGKVVLLHDSSEESGHTDRTPTLEALRTLLPELAAQGYRCVTVDEMVKGT